MSALFFLIGILFALFLIMSFFARPFFLTENPLFLCILFLGFLRVRLLFRSGSVRVLCVSWFGSCSCHLRLGSFQMRLGGPFHLGFTKLKILFQSFPLRLIIFRCIFVSFNII